MPSSRIIRGSARSADQLERRTTTSLIAPAARGTNATEMSRNTNATASTTKIMSNRQATTSAPSGGPITAPAFQETRSQATAWRRTSDGSDDVIRAAETGR